ncbi:MAG: transglutaminase domain-containing protein [Clostridiales bacterium]|nr:transglutaminase domain-containing protein [Clostridiales bacterium]
METKEAYRISRRGFLLLIFSLVMVLALVMCAIKRIERFDGKVNAEVVIEAGEGLDMGLFTGDPDYVHPTIDINTIDTTIPGTYPITFWCDNIRYVSMLTIQDTIPPQGSVRDLERDLYDMPTAMDFVVDYSDVTEVKIDFKDTPDVLSGGEKDGSVRFTDTSGNETILPVKLTVIDDFDPPKIYGIHPIESYQGDNIKYREDITLEDSQDPNPVLTIDNSEVNIDKPGEYRVKYIATDNTGNSTEAYAKVTILEKPEGYVEPDLVYEEASKVLDEIVDDSMSDEQKGFKIYAWCKNNLHYIGTSDKSHWTAGAYEGFTTLRGDCYTYAVCAKALFDVAGIDNYVVERNDARDSSHFWNLLRVEDGWYFMDCSSTNTPMNAYLLTEDELDALNYIHGFRYHFDHEGLPTISKESLQDKLNYYNYTVAED